MNSKSMRSPSTDVNSNSLVQSSLLLTVDADLKIIELSNNWQPVMGYCTEELIGKHISVPFILPSEGDLYRSLDTASIDQIEDTLDTGLRHKSGGVINARVHILPIVGRSSHRLSLFITIQSELNSLASNQEYRLFTKAAKLGKFGFWSIDLHTSRLFWSSEIYSIHGVTPNSYTPSMEDAFVFCHPDDRREAQRIVLNGIEKRLPWSFKVRIVQPSGDIRIVRFHAEFDFDQSFEATEVYGICLDITDYEALNEQVELLSEVAETSITGITICDKNRNLMWANKKFEEITGYSLADVQGHKVGGFLQGPGTDPNTIREISRLLDTGKNVDVEILNYNKEQIPYWIHLLISPVKRKGEVSHYVAIQHDITEQKRQQQMQARGSKMDAVGQMAARVCHDINNIMAIISGNTQLLRLQNPSEKANKFLGNIEMATARASSVTKKLVKLVKDENLSPELISLNKEIKNIVDALPEELKGKTSFQFNFDYKDPLLVKKKSLLESVKQLIINAILATDKLGEVTISTLVRAGFDNTCNSAVLSPKLGKEYVLISVKDNGIGIGPDVINNIFDPFFSTRDRKDGAGLGLSFIFNFCAKEEAGLQLTSQENKGSEFTIWVPKFV